MIFSFRVFSKPLMTERTTIRAMTPTMTPAMEMTVMMEMKVCFRLALRYLRPINHSYLMDGYFSMRSRGKKMTSRMDAASVRSITRRSMPIPSPAVGGIPNSRAWRKSSSSRRTVSVSSLLLPKLLDETLPLIDRIVQLGKPVGDLPSRDEKLKPVHHVRVLGVPAGKGRDVRRVMGDERGLNQPGLDQLVEELGQDPSVGCPLFQIETEVSRHGDRP